MDCQDIPPTAGQNQEFRVPCSDAITCIHFSNLEFTALENQEYNHDKATGNAEKNLRIFFVKLCIYINFGWVPTH